MGNQVVVAFLTDHWNEVKAKPKKLVDAIDIGMTSGTDSLIRQVQDHESGHMRGYDAENWARRHYVTVHRFRHADEPQVTFTQHNSSWDVSDFSYAIGRGLLDLKTNPKTWVRIGRDMVKSLRQQATLLEEALDKYEREHPDANA